MTGQDLRGSPRRFQRQGYAGAEDWIQEFGRVADERKARTIKLLHRAGKATHSNRRKNSLHVPQSRGRIWIALDNGAKLRFRFGRKWREKPGLPHDANTAFAIRKWNNPNPRATRMNAHPDFALLAVSGPTIA